MPINKSAQPSSPELQALLKIRGIADSQPTPEERGIISGARKVRDESAVEIWARRQNAMLDWNPIENRDPNVPTPIPPEHGLKILARRMGGALDFEPYDAGPSEDEQSNRSTAASRSRANRPTLGSRRSEVEAIKSDPVLTSQISSGTGYKFVGVKGQNFTRPDTKRLIELIGQQWNQLHPGSQIRIGAVGNVYGGQLPKRFDKSGKATAFHLSHQTGLDLDIKLVSQDLKAADTIDSPDYSPELTKELLELFLHQKILNVKVIFFEGKVNLPKVEWREGHGNHFHVRFLAPSK
jgi:hypothetical protein